MTELDNDFLSLQHDENSILYKAINEYGFELESFLNWRFQIKHQVVNEQEAARYKVLHEDEKKGYKQLEPLFQSGVTPYYMILGDFEEEESKDHSSNPIRLQSIPSVKELYDAEGQKDPLLEVDHSPVKEVVHVYPDRVAFCVAQLCPVYCRYCFRKRRDETNGLHFNREILKRGIQYIRDNPSIKDVLITGGDPFIASDEAIENLLMQIRDIPHVEIIRFGTRTPVTLPYRITDKLCNILKKYHPVWLNTHFNHALELTPDAKLAINKLNNAGIPVGNQSVLLKGVNDSIDQMYELLRGLLKSRVRPYYVFHPHTIEGTEHLRVSVKKGLEIMKYLRGKITGFGIPNYVLDTPSGKVPITHNYILGSEGQDLLLETPHGEIWREKGVWY